MGAIKDVVDLATKLSESVTDRRFADDLFKIIQLINTIQAEQVGLTEKNIELVEKNSSLKQSISTLRTETTRLQQQISDLQNAPTNEGSDVSEEEKNILVFLVENKRLTAQGVSRGTGIDLVKTEYWLIEMAKKEFVSVEHAFNQPARVSLGQEGRRYLVLNGLI